MEEFKVGTFIEPKKAEWGHGVVVHKSDDFAYVYFENQDDNIAKKFRFNSLTACEIEGNERLARLGAELNADGRYKVVADGRRMPSKRPKKAAKKAAEA